MEIRINILKGIGHISHYGHFIHDLVLPFTVWYLELDPEERGSLERILITEPVGAMADKFLELFDIQLFYREPDPETVDNLGCIDLAGYGFGPYPVTETVKCRDYLVEKFNDHKTYPPIILIERGKNFEGSGYFRRHIENHQQLFINLKLAYGKKFVNLQLENLSMKEQINYFRNARLIIGQHGAGLCNILWNSGGSVIELSQSLPPTFENLSRTLKLDYHKIPLKNNVAPVTDIIELVRKIVIEI